MFESSSSQFTVEGLWWAGWWTRGRDVRPLLWCRWSSLDSQPGLMEWIAENKHFKYIKLMPRLEDSFMLVIYQIDRPSDCLSILVGLDFCPTNFARFNYIVIRYAPTSWLWWSMILNYSNVWININKMTADVLQRHS